MHAPAPRSIRLAGRHALAAALTLSLAACATTRTPYERPVTDVPAQWSTVTATASSDAATVQERWWQAFGDPTLDALVERALARNNDLAAATIRVRRAQLQADLARNAFVPSVSASVSAGASRRIDESAPTSRSNSASLSASYEVDLWNRLGSERDAATWNAVATAEDREATALTLVGTTAGLYWQLAYLNERVAVSEASLDVAERTLAFVRVQYGSGAVSGLEVADAEQSLASQRASHASLLQQRAETRNALAILFDAPPGDPGVDPSRLPATDLPAVAAGLPADLLARRPDLRAAELRLRATLAGVDATRASFYPRLSLTAGAGSSSTSLLDVLKNPVGSLGAALSLPFLQVNQMRLNIGVSQTQYDEAVVTFRQTLYQALADTADALAARDTLAERATLLAESLESARRAERLYEVRYKAGAVALRAWLDAQERRRSAEIAWTEGQLARLNNQVLVYQVLGGGTRPAGEAIAGG